MNDAFKAVTRYWDRITHPAQILASLPQAVAAMLDPADCGPAFLALPQDIQEVAFDYPLAFFEERTWAIPRAASGPPQARRGRRAAQDREEADPHRRRRRALFAGREGGRGIRRQTRHSRLSRRTPARAASRIIITRMPARSASSVRLRPTRSPTDADVILAIGTRLQDFTTGSWTAFSPEARFISINAARFDAVKHRAVAVVGDALGDRDGARRRARRLARRTLAHEARAKLCSRNGMRCSTSIRRRPTRRFRPMRRSWRR